MRVFILVFAFLLSIANAGYPRPFYLREALQNAEVSMYYVEQKKSLVFNLRDIKYEDDMEALFLREAKEQKAYFTDEVYLNKAMPYCLTGFKDSLNKALNLSFENWQNSRVGLFRTLKMVVEHHWGFVRDCVTFYEEAKVTPEDFDISYIKTEYDKIFDLIYAKLEDDESE